MPYIFWKLYETKKLYSSIYSKDIYTDKSKIIILLIYSGKSNWAEEFSK